jgi:hypothetical protein
VQQALVLHLSSHVTLCCKFNPDKQTFEAFARAGVVLTASHAMLQANAYCQLREFPQVSDPTFTVTTMRFEEKMRSQLDELGFHSQRIPAAANATTFVPFDVERLTGISEEARAFIKAHLVILRFCHAPLWCVLCAHPVSFCAGWCLQGPGARGCAWRARLPRVRP